MSLQNEKTKRMLAVHERNEKLRAAATIVVPHGEQPPSGMKESVYVESATASLLRRIFEDGEQPYWLTSN